MLALSFFLFLLAGSKVRPADTRDNIFLSIPGRFQLLYNSRGISVHAFEFSSAENLSAQHMG